jgi:hypothetical protein
MKLIKKLFAIIISLVILSSIPVTAYAAECTTHITYPVDTGQTAQTNLHYEYHQYIYEWRVLPDGTYEPQYRTCTIRVTDRYAIYNFVCRYCNKIISVDVIKITTRTHLNNCGQPWL